ALLCAIERPFQENGFQSRRPISNGVLRRLGRFLSRLARFTTAGRPEFEPANPDVATLFCECPNSIVADWFRELVNQLGHDQEVTVTHGRAIAISVLKALKARMV